MRILLGLILLLASAYTKGAEPIKLGLFYGQDFQSVAISIVSGSLSLQMDGKNSITMSNGQSCSIQLSNGKFSVSLAGQTLQASNFITFKNPGNTVFKIQPTGVKTSVRTYEGSLKVVKAPGRIQLVNILPLESYIPGVIEAEGGANHELEYYKVQAIISRTYACSNLRRHEAEGYNVCDATHCQVYHGIAKHEPLVRKATEETYDVVIVDQNIDLITAAFHSNCGGHTNNAEDVWSKPLSYCVGKPDTFCLVMPHSNWEKTIPLHQWKSYLNTKRYPVSDSAYASALAFFPSEKQVFFVDSSFKIPTKIIRQDFKLRSSFFTVHQNGEDVTFVGQGFGHGVGLCQEGAIRMARLGFSYKEIIHYYYTDIHLIPLRFLWFFKEDPH